MKAVIGLLVVAGICFGGYYVYKQSVGFDPDKQGREVRAQIKPGMTLKQVLDLAGPNAKYQAINKFETRQGKEVVQETQVGTPVELKPDLLEKRIRDGQVPEGFVLTYTYSARYAFSITFDSAGVVLGVEKAFTEGDLYKSPGERSDE